MYFEVYNQKNVLLVDLRETPIERITAEGVLTERRTGAQVGRAYTGYRLRHGLRRPDRHQYQRHIGL
jgi:hypothetical protein